MVICFNNGSSKRLEVLEQLGIVPGSNTKTALIKIDRLRAYEANKVAADMTEEARTLKRKQKEDQELKNKQDYSPGMFS